MTPRERTRIFAEQLAQLLRDNRIPAKLTETTSGSALIRTTIDAHQMNVTITTARR